MRRARPYPEEFRDDPWSDHRHLPDEARAAGRPRAPGPDHQRPVLCARAGPQGTELGAVPSGTAAYGPRVPHGSRAVGAAGTYLVCPPRDLPEQRCFRHDDVVLPPESLPDPSSLWSAWSRLSGALGVLGVKDVWWTTDDGHAHHDDHGGSRSTLTVLDGDRGVLHGWDRDATFDRHDVTRAAPPVDLFAGAPSWLPFDELREASDTDQLGWLFWYEPGNGRARAPYPDGLTDGSTRLLLPVTTDAGFEGVVQEWARDDDELARAQTAARTAPAPPTSLARSTGARPGRPLMSVQEQDTLAEAAARDSRELPRPAPAPSPVLERVVATVRAAVPRGRSGSITAWLGEGTATVFDDGAVTAHELDLVGPLREPQHTEASETGQWSFVTVVVDDGDVRVARAYDTVPSWWEREDYDYPSLPPLAELRARPATWQPDWMDLLEDRTRTEGYRLATPTSRDGCSGATSRSAETQRTPVTHQMEICGLPLREPTVCAYAGHPHDPAVRTGAAAYE